MITQTREEISDRIEREAPRANSKRDAYIFLLLEMLLDVMTDIRDSLQPVQIVAVKEPDKRNRI